MNCRKLPGWDAGDARELVQVERERAREVGLTGAMQPPQLRVGGDRRAPGRQTEHHVGPFAQQRVGNSPGHAQRAVSSAVSKIRISTRTVRCTTGP